MPSRTSKTAMIDHVASANSDIRVFVYLRHRLAFKTDIVISVYVHIPNASPDSEKNTRVMVGLTP